MTELEQVQGAGRTGGNQGETAAGQHFTNMSCVSTDVQGHTWWRSTRNKARDGNKEHTQTILAPRRAQEST